MSEFDSTFPILAHESVPGVECDGCIVVRVTRNDAELICNVCGAVVGVVRVEILRDLVSMIPDVKSS